MLQNLPDLTFMRAQVLMFPVRRDDESPAGKMDSHVAPTKADSTITSGDPDRPDASMKTIPMGIRTISYS